MKCRPHLEMTLNRRGIAENNAERKMIRRRNQDEDPKRMLGRKLKEHTVD